MDTKCCLITLQYWSIKYIKLMENCVYHHSHRYELHDFSTEQGYVTVVKQSCKLTIAFAVKNQQCDEWGHVSCSW